MYGVISVGAAIVRTIMERKKHKCERNFRKLEWFCVERKYILYNIQIPDDVLTIHDVQCCIEPDFITQYLLCVSLIIYVF